MAPEIMFKRRPQDAALVTILLNVLQLAINNKILLEENSAS